MLKIDSPTWKYRERGSIWMVTPYDSETFRTTSQSITSSMDEGLLNRSSGFFVRYYLNHWWLRVSMSLFIALCIDRLTCDTYVRFGNLNYFLCLKLVAWFSDCKNRWPTETRPKLLLRDNFNRNSKRCTRKREAGIPYLKLLSPVLRRLDFRCFNGQYLIQPDAFCDWNETNLHFSDSRIA